MSDELKQTPLRELHRRSGGRLVGFAGWELPVQYAGINEEHQAVRQRVGIFDVSHMGQIEVEGPRALAFLQHLLPPDLERLAVGGLCYAVMCNPAGGAIDDLLVYRLGEQHYLLVVNASRVDADLDWIAEQAGPYGGARVLLRGAAWGMLALQGPLAAQVLGEVGAGRALDLGYLEHQAARVAGAPVLVSRSGYTGEDGFELICPADCLVPVWEALVAREAQPCGLGARDVLRTEMGYCLYGHELTPAITPLEAGLSWSLALDKEPGFVGREALRQQAQVGGFRRLVGLSLVEQGIPRPEYRVVDPQGREVGQVSSGTFSPGLQRGIALAYVEAGCHLPGTRLAVEVRGKPRWAEVVRTPFVPSRTKRRRPSR
ncbi:MAG: glycine cleavage system aminomethyltransferase GcvT [Candidatus Latescibacteria bacterium]|nr:glycine cleavage system aminomethyltransferase GcvT [Candidatus Latescibacterota bacterium]